MYKIKKKHLRVTVNMENTVHELQEEISIQVLEKTLMLLSNLKFN